MKKLEKEVVKTAEDLLERNLNITTFEALQIAVKIQHNRVLEDAYLVGYTNQPTALEAIAMSLGFNNIK